MTLSRTCALLLFASLALWRQRAGGGDHDGSEPAPAETIADTLKQTIASEDLQRMAVTRTERRGEVARLLTGRLSALEENFDKLAVGALRKRVNQFTGARSLPARVAFRG